MLIRKVDKRIQQYLSFLDQKKYSSIKKLSVFADKTSKIYHSVPSDLKYTEIRFPYYYGEESYNWWFISSFTVPSNYLDKEIFLYAPVGADCLVFINNVPKAALNPYHTKIKLTTEEKQCKEITVAMEAYSGHIIPGYHPLSSPRVLITLSKQISAYPIEFPTMELLVKNTEIYNFYYDISVLYDLATQLDPDSLRRNKILYGLYHALIKLHFTADGPTLTHEILEASLKIKPLLQKRNSDTIPEIYSIGHAHIDHAWLWTLSETARKAARTYVNMTRYINEYPEFIYLQSQPAQLEMVKEHYPAIFKEIVSAFNKGQWEPNAGMYVEADCNIPNGESLIRQFLEGLRVTQENFLYKADTLWLPDVFGYSAALPQIMKGCGIKYFVTSKINWNDTTRFPYDTFYWSGIDGTSIKTHFITTAYDVANSVGELFNSWKRVQHKEVQDSLLKPIGEGDGGGGTSRSDLETMRRMIDLEGCPRNKWMKISEALDKIFLTTADLPTWHGELYLELHRGTYTTIANTKKYNRYLEQQLRNIEFFSVFCTSKISESFNFGVKIDYPTDILQKAWKQLLINQFHDIIPGSGITKVNQEALESYKIIAETLNGLEKKLSEIFLPLNESDQSKNRLVIINSLSWERDTFITLPKLANIDNLTGIKNKYGKSPIQATENINGEKVFISHITIPSMGIIWAELLEESINFSNPFKWEDQTLTTPYYNVGFNEKMEITSLKYINDDFNFVSEKMAFNQLKIAEDIPVSWDAWDIEWDYQEKLENIPTPNKTEIISNGPLFFQLRHYYTFNKSRIVQDTIFYSNNERIDFITKVYWYEEYTLLKTVFLVNFFSDIIKCEIQYGHINRSTVKNRLHEQAMYEFCAHKWVSMDDGARGIALLNDSKYGHSATRNSIGLTLLRSPKAPDPEADIGEHVFTYSILPFKRSFNSKIIQMAYELNSKPMIFEGHLKNTDIEELSFLQSSNPAIIIETIKKSVQGNSIIIRMYEATGSKNITKLEFHTAFSEIYKVNMIEEDKFLLSKNEKSLELTFEPFEILSLLYIPFH